MSRKSDGTFGALYELFHMLGPIVSVWVLILASLLPGVAVMFLFRTFFEAISPYVSFLEPYGWVPYALGGAVSLNFLLAAISARKGSKMLRSIVASVTKDEELQQYTWQEFEEMVAEAYRRRGYGVQLLGGSTPDEGVDIVIASASGETRLVQCKHWKKWKVGVKIVRELAGVVAKEGASGGDIVAASFTNPAKAFAANSTIRLIDSADLMNVPDQRR